MPDENDLARARQMVLDMERRIESIRSELAVLKRPSKKAAPPNKDKE